MNIFHEYFHYNGYIAFMNNRLRRLFLHEYFSCLSEGYYTILHSCSTALQLADWLVAKCMRVAGSLLICNSSDSTTKSILPRDGCKPRPWIPCSIKIAKRLGSLHRSCDMETTATWTLGEIWSCNQSNWLLNKQLQTRCQAVGRPSVKHLKPTKSWLCLEMDRYISHFHPNFHPG